MLKPQWWVACDKMAAEACDAARSKELEILPNFMEPTWFRWLENIRDWCIATAVVGHRIPAYYVKFEGEAEEECGMPRAVPRKLDRWVIGREEDEARAEAEKKFPGKAFTLEQDEDVLDTWFSSGLFPFSVFGWPDETRISRVLPNRAAGNRPRHPVLLGRAYGHDGHETHRRGSFKQVYLHHGPRRARGRCPNPSATSSTLFTSSRASR